MSGHTSTLAAIVSFAMLCASKTQAQFPSPPSLNVNWRANLSGSIAPLHRPQNAVATLFELVSNHPALGSGNMQEDRAHLAAITYRVDLALTHRQIEKERSRRRTPLREPVCMSEAPLRPNFTVLDILKKDNSVKERGLIKPFPYGRREPEMRADSTPLWERQLLNRFADRHYDFIKN